MTFKSYEYEFNVRMRKQESIRKRLEQEEQERKEQEEQERKYKEYREWWKGRNVDSLNFSIQHSCGGGYMPDYKLHFDFADLRKKDWYGE